MLNRIVTTAKVYLVIVIPNNVFAGIEIKEDTILILFDVEKIIRILDVNTKMNEDSMGKRDKFLLIGVCFQLVQLQLLKIYYAQ